MQAGTRLEKKEAVTPCLSGSQKLTAMRNVFCSDRDSFSQATLKHSAPPIHSYAAPGTFLCPALNVARPRWSPCLARRSQEGHKQRSPFSFGSFLRQHTYFLLIYFKLKPPAHTIWAESCKTFSEQGRIFGCLFSMGCNAQTREKLCCIRGQQLPPKSWTCPIPLGPFNALP